VANEDQVA